MTINGKPASTQRPVNKKLGTPLNRPKRAKLRPFTKTICGIRNSGKTYLALMKLLTLWRFQFDMIIIVSPTWILQPQCRVIHRKGVIVFNRFSGEIFKKLRDYLEAHAKQKPNVLVLVDDTSSYFRYDPDDLTSLFQIGRHYHLSILMLCQRISQLPPNARTQLDEITLFAEGNLRELKFLHNEFGSGMDLNTFISTMKNKTSKKYSYLSINNDAGRLIYS